MIANAESCPICSVGDVRFIGNKVGRLDKREYAYFHCNTCHYSFVANPRTDFETVYSENYYRGLGADPSVDYLYELENPAVTVRNYEWKGILTIFEELASNRARWLDFGCGTGGLVGYVRRFGVDAVGFEEGFGALVGRRNGIPILSADELNLHQQSFDFVSAIEVLEHVSNPLEMLRTVRSLLRPGGIFFFTTGNAKPWRGRLLQWSYASCPEVHISFFEPQTLELAFHNTGFEVRQGTFPIGYLQIIQYKILKCIGIRHTHRIFDFLPWNFISVLVDRRYQVSKMPIGVAVHAG